MMQTRDRLLALCRIVGDAPAAFRNRIRIQGYRGTLKAVPEMMRFAARHYLRVGTHEAPATPHESTYDDWLRANAWTDQRRQDLLGRLRAAGAGERLPKISVVMPVYNPPVKWLNRAIETVQNQVYDNWELCIADDASTRPEVRLALQAWQDRDPRIKVVFRTQNGHISRATNSAAELATGDFVALMDHDDELSPDCLGEVALKIVQNPDTDVLYTDNDKIDEGGGRYDPQFKAEYSPELLLCYMYFCHLFVVRRSLYQQLGGMRAGFEGSQDHDLALRAVEVARKVTHVHGVHYHWRAIQGSTALSGNQKAHCFEVTRQCVQEALTRRGLPAVAYHPDWTDAVAVGDCALDFPDEGPSVEIIIPTRNQVKLLRVCIESLKRTTYRNFKILVVDNESDDPETIEYLRTIPGRVIRIASPNGKFSYAYLNNRAVEHAQADYVLLLNNDTEVMEEKWLSRMMGYAQLKGVGSVGARLLFPDLRVQHAGIVHSGVGESLPYHLFKFLPHTDPGYLRWSLTTRNVAAVTAACMVTPRKLFLDSGGLDETRFKVAFNDVDYGYRLTKAGYRNVYCATAILKHYESVSRGYSDDPQEHIAVRSIYGQWVDPYLSPHLLADHNVRPRG